MGCVRKKFGMHLAKTMGYIGNKLSDRVRDLFGKDYGIYREKTMG